MNRGSYQSARNNGLRIKKGKSKKHCPKCAASNVKVVIVPKSEMFFAKL